jgi:hypothetical protein
MRIQLELSDNSVEQIRELMKQASIKTYSELFGNALAILNWAVKESRNGRIIVSADEKNNETVKELSMPVLQAVSGK